MTVAEAEIISEEALYSGDVISSSYKFQCAMFVCLALTAGTHSAWSLTLQLVIQSCPSGPYYAPGGTHSRRSQLIKLEVILLWLR